MEKNKIRECKRCYRSEEIWLDIDIWFVVKFDGNVCDIWENVVVRFVENSKKLFKVYSARVKIKIYKVLYNV